MSEVVEDPRYPDRIGVGDGPGIPCKVTEFSVTTMPTGAPIDQGPELNATYEQTRQYRIRYELPPAPVEQGDREGLDAAIRARLDESWGAPTTRLSTVLGLLDSGGTRCECGPDDPYHPADFLGSVSDANGRDHQQVHGEDIRVVLAAARSAWGGLLAVLDLHKPMHDVLPECSHCFGRGDVTNTDYPCPTVRAIAQALGSR